MERQDLGWKHPQKILEPRVGRHYLIEPEEPVRRCVVSPSQGAFVSR
jgi:hypothetical protein